MNRFYPIALYVIALAIVLSVTMADTRYLVGVDVHLESYFAFRALDGWDYSLPHPGNSALGDVLLGTPFMFKIGFPLFFAAVPVILYFIYRRFLTDTQAFLASIFFIAIPTFTMEIPSIARQMFAEFWLALFLWLLIAKKSPWLMAGAGLLVILCHYSLGLVLIVLAIAYFILLAIFKLFRQKLQQRLWVTGVLAVFLLASGIGYYSTVAYGTPFKYLAAISPVKARIGSLSIGYAIKDQALMAKEQAEAIAAAEPKKPDIKLLTGGYVVGLAQSYDTVMRAALGLDFPKASPLGKAYRVIQFITFALLAIGTLYSLFSKRMRALLKPEYLALMIISCGILGLCVLSPGFASILNGTRWYHIALFALAPMIVIGMKVIMGRANDSVLG